MQAKKVEYNLNYTHVCWLHCWQTSVLHALQHIKWNSFNVQRAEIWFFFLSFFTAKVRKQKWYHIDKWSFVLAFQHFSDIVNIKSSHTHIYIHRINTFYWVFKCTFIRISSYIRKEEKNKYIYSNVICMCIHNAFGSVVYLREAISPFTSPVE